MVICFLANGFEEVEALTPVDCLRRCEKEVLTVGIGGVIVKSSHGVPVIADIEDNELKMSPEIEMKYFQEECLGLSILKKTRLLARLWTTVLSMTFL